MNRKLNIYAAFLVLALALLLTACGAGGDRVERFAAAAPSDSGGIDIPGYESLSFKAGSLSQSVNLRNPQTNDCYFVLSLITDSETLWTSDEIEPGEAVKKLTLSRTLDKGEYDAVLHYDCFTLNDKSPLNGAEIKLKLIVN